MSGFVVMVDFFVAEGRQQEFRRLIDANARASVRDEPGCRQFDVVEPRGQLGRIFLYEIYDDEAAFDAHRETPHFKSFDAESAPLVTDKRVVVADLVCAG